MITPRGIGLALLFNLGALVAATNASADYVGDARYAADRLTTAFYREDGGELDYALRSLTIACFSEQAEAMSPAPKLEPPCDAFLLVLRQGCSNADHPHPVYVCTGRLIEQETARVRGWPLELRDLLQTVHTKLLALEQLELSKKGKR